MLMYNFMYLCLCAHVCESAGLLGTCAVSSSAVNVVIGFPLLSNLVGVDEYDQHCHQTDERHQHRRAQSCIDVRDEAPRRATEIHEGLMFVSSYLVYLEKRNMYVKTEGGGGHA